MQEELERYKKEVLEGLQIEEEGLTDLVRKKTKQASSTDTTRSYNDPVDGASTYANNNIKDQILKNSLNNLKTGSDSTLSISLQLNTTEGNVSSKVSRRRHRKRHVTDIDKSDR